MSVEPYSIEHMFERLVEVDPAACESALIERIAELERIKSAAAAARFERRAPWTRCVEPTKQPPMCLLRSAGVVWPARLR